MLIVGAFGPVFHLVVVPSLRVHPRRAAKRETRQFLEQIFPLLRRLLLKLASPYDIHVIRRLISSGCSHGLNF